MGFAADDSQHQRQPKHTRPHKGGGRTADTKPNGQGILQRPGVDGLISEGGPKLTRPIDNFVIANGEQEIQLLRKQGIIILKPETKQGEGFGEGATADNHFCAALRN